MYFDIVDLCISCRQLIIREYYVLVLRWHKTLKKPYYNKNMSLFHFILYYMLLYLISTFGTVITFEAHIVLLACFTMNLSQTVSLILLMTLARGTIPALESSQQSSCYQVHIHLGGCIVRKLHGVFLGLTARQEWILCLLQIMVSNCARCVHNL